MRVKFLYKEDNSGIRKGSLVTRLRWTGILEDLGHEVVEAEPNLVIAFHAYKS